MTSAEFLRPKLHGLRFADGEIPLEFLGDLVALQEMVLEVAKWRFLEDNPTRSRAPRGFKDEVHLTLAKLEKGSVTPVINLSADSPLTLLALIPYQKYLNEAAKHIIQSIAAQEEPTQPIANGSLPRKYYAYYDRIGRSLRGEEFIELSSPASDISGKLNQEKRRRLLEVSRIQEHTQQVSLRGSVPEADQDKMTFVLQTVRHNRVSGPIPEQLLDSIIEAFNGYRDGVRVLIHGVGKYSQQNRLLRLESVESISDIDALDVPARLDEFRGLPNGWLEGSGWAPDHLGLDWLSEEFDRRVPSGISLPFTYPTEEGGIRMEWSHENNAMILEIDLRSRRGDWLWFDRGSEAETEKELNLEDSADWEWLITEIRNKTAVEA